MKQRRARNSRFLKGDNAPRPHDRLRRLARGYARLLPIAIVAVSFTACLSAYRYESMGTVTDSTGINQEAILYFGEEEGRRWTGKRRHARDSGVDLKICLATDSSFVPTSESNLVLLLKSRGGDIRVAELLGDGRIQELDPPQRLHPNEACGYVLLDGQKVDIEALDEGTQPTIAILCENQRRPDRYPPAAIYKFDPFTRIKVQEEREPSSPCDGRVEIDPTE